MVTDVHIHAHGGEKGEEVLRAMDYAGLERIVLFSREPRPQDKALGHKGVIDEVAKVAAVDPSRIFAFAWIEPPLPDAEDMVDYALGEKKLAGVKMIPNGWYPEDERPQACYRKIEQHRKPMLFHSGISWGHDSKYCRPVGYEIMMRYPGIRFALAHMSWPWTDEAIAVADKFRNLLPAAGHEATCYLDITRGAPRPWKKDALQKALYQPGDTWLIYGSDRNLPEQKDLAIEFRRDDEDVLREIGASQETITRVMSTNASRWLGLA